MGIVPMHLRKMSLLMYRGMVLSQSGLLWLQSNGHHGLGGYLQNGRDKNLVRNSTQQLKSTLLNQQKRITSSRHLYPCWHSPSHSLPSPSIPSPMNRFDHCLVSPVVVVLHVVVLTYSFVLLSSCFLPPSFPRVAPHLCHHCCHQSSIARCHHHLSPPSPKQQYLMSSIILSSLLTSCCTLSLLPPPPLPPIGWIESSTPQSWLFFVGPLWASRSLGIIAAVVPTPFVTFAVIVVMIPTTTTARTEQNNIGN